MLYPLTFEPIIKERVWGSECWTVSDRPGDESIVVNGSLAGRSLRTLMIEHRDALLGSAATAASDRFPLLCKIIDARQTLSVQVHPPAARAAELGGEPKTEMWYIDAAQPGAELYVGLKRGVTRADFEQRIREGTVANALHRIAVTPGDVMFLPSGRIHAIGAGIRLYEIQQNSDTTYRVFDWNRPGSDGKPRQLHLSESLTSIDFDDVEPSLAPDTRERRGRFTSRSVVRDDLFDVTVHAIDGEGSLDLEPEALQIVTCTDGSGEISAGSVSLPLPPGGFCVVPAATPRARLSARSRSVFLVARAH